MDAPLLSIECIQIVLNRTGRGINFIKRYQGFRMCVMTSQLFRYLFKNTDIFGDIEIVLVNFQFSWRLYWKYNKNVSRQFPKWKVVYIDTQTCNANSLPVPDSDTSVWKNLFIYLNMKIHLSSRLPHAISTFKVIIA